MSDWYIIDGDWKHDDLPDSLSGEYVSPYPSIFWMWEDDYKSEAIPTALSSSVQTQPVSEIVWVITNGDFATANTPAPVVRGAFANCTLLETAHIPESVKSIGEYSFRNTALESVKIASDCTYSVTSFPENCEIEYYSDPENESEGDNNE